MNVLVYSICMELAATNKSSIYKSNYFLTDFLVLLLRARQCIVHKPMMNTGKQVR